METAKYGYYTRTVRELKITENLIITGVNRGEVTAESGDADSNMCKFIESSVF